ncbi:hypothetical protein CERSUDRAFT_96693 [Gelatoporia subvermispora B]|uniref:Uncharacterized protein n=1 Tax=Ceriporiopsis subvermispora (strain B) TaxID=914234 RepID=M2R9X9_CERS8|nr:hypothetical protein CERSUDRAFT_96693 [Gelatoporia subvermispora B]
MAQRQNVWNPLLNLLLRDGTLYFLALLSLNALSIAGWISDVFTVASTFSIPLSSIIISHFLLNLRKITNVSTSSRGSSSGTQDEDLDQLCSCVSTPVLSSFLGNMGELLDYDADGDIDVMWEGVDDVHHGAEDVGVEHHCARDSSNKRIIPTECSSSREQAQRIEYIRAAVTVNRPGL